MKTDWIESHKANKKNNLRVRFKLENSKWDGLLTRYIYREGSSRCYANRQRYANVVSPGNRETVNWVEPDETIKRRFSAIDETGMKYTGLGSAKLDRQRNMETPFRWARAILFWKMGSCITRAVKELADKLFTISVMVFNWKSWIQPSCFYLCL